MNKTSFHLATLFKIPININYTWFIVLGLVIFSLASSYFPATNPGLDIYAYWLMAFVAALLLFSSLLAHEFAHCLVARQNNLPINGITLFIFGGIAQLGKEPTSPGVEFRMALAGPVMSFFLAAIFFVLTMAMNSLKAPAFTLSILNYLVLLNLAVGIVNLIPGFPLDGGRIFRAVIWSFSHNLKKATAIASSFGKAFALLLMLLGLVNLFNAFFLSGIWFIFIGLFLYEAAESSYRQLGIDDILHHVKLTDLIVRKVITVNSNITLDKLVNEYFFRFRHHSFPVVDNNQVRGLITLHEVKAIPREEWSKVMVGQIMLPLKTDLFVTEKASPLVALTKMASNNVGRLLIMENDQLQGIVSQRDFLNLFEFKAEIED